MNQFYKTNYLSNWGMVNMYFLNCFVGPSFQTLKHIFFIISANSSRSQFWNSGLWCKLYEACKIYKNTLPYFFILKQNVPKTLYNPIKHSKIQYFGNENILGYSTRDAKNKKYHAKDCFNILKGRNMAADTWTMGNSKPLPTSETFISLELIYLLQWFPSHQRALESS